MLLKKVETDKGQLEIVYDVQWKTPGNDDDKAKIIGIVDTPDTNLDWNTFKSYLIQNSGNNMRLGTDDIRISYLDSDDDLIPIDSELEFRECLKFSRTRARRGRKIIMKVFMTSNGGAKPKSCSKYSSESSSKNPRLFCLKKKDITQNFMMKKPLDKGDKIPDTNIDKNNSVPDWFDSYMLKFKSELIEEITSAVVTNVRSALANAAAPPANWPLACHLRSRIGSDLPQQGASSLFPKAHYHHHYPIHHALEKRKKKKKMPEEDSSDCTDGLQLQWEERLELLRHMQKNKKNDKKFEKKLDAKLEKLECKTKKIMEKKHSLWRKSCSSVPTPSTSGLTQSHQVTNGGVSLEPSAPVANDLQVSCNHGMDAMPINNGSYVPHVPCGDLFHQVWNVKNNGQKAWTEETELRFAWGSKSLVPLTTVIKCPLLKPDEIGQISVTLQAPMFPGSFESYWNFHHQGRRFGHWVGCEVIVDPDPRAVALFKEMSPYKKKHLVDSCTQGGTSNSGGNSSSSGGGGADGSGGSGMATSGGVSSDQGPLPVDLTMKCQQQQQQQQSYSDDMKVASNQLQESQDSVVFECKHLRESLPNVVSYKSPKRSNNNNNNNNNNDTTTIDTNTTATVAKNIIPAEIPKFLEDSSGYLLDYINLNEGLIQHPPPLPPPPSSSSTMSMSSSAATTTTTAIPLGTVVPDLVKRTDETVNNILSAAASAPTPATATTTTSLYDLSTYVQCLTGDNDVVMEMATSTITSSAAPPPATAATTTLNIDSSDKIENIEHVLADKLEKNDEQQQQQDELNTENKIINEDHDVGEYISGSDSDNISIISGTISVDTDDSEPTNEFVFVPMPTCVKCDYDNTSQTQTTGLNDDDEDDDDDNNDDIDDDDDDGGDLTTDGVEPKSKLKQSVTPLHVTQPISVEIPKSPTDSDNAVHGSDNNNNMEELQPFPEIPPPVVLMPIPDDLSTSTLILQQQQQLQQSSSTAAVAGNNSATVITVKTEIINNDDDDEDSFESLPNIPLTQQQYDQEKSTEDPNTVFVRDESGKSVPVAKVVGTGYQGQSNVSHSTFGDPNFGQGPTGPRFPLANDIPSAVSPPIFCQNPGSVRIPPQPQFQQPQPQQQLQQPQPPPQQQQQQQQQQHQHSQQHQHHHNQQQQHHYSQHFYHHQQQQQPNHHHFMTNANFVVTQPPMHQQPQQQQQQQQHFYQQQQQQQQDHYFLQQQGIRVYPTVQRSYANNTSQDMPPQQQQPQQQFNHAPTPPPPPPPPSFYPFDELYQAQEMASSSTGDGVSWTNSYHNIHTEQPRSCKFTYICNNDGKDSGSTCSSGNSCGSTNTNGSKSTANIGSVCGGSNSSTSASRRTSSDARETSPVSAAVQILPETLVTGAVNVASSALNTARSVIDMLRPRHDESLVSQWEPVPQHMEASLRTLQEMGFVNRDLNIMLLKQYKNDVARVISELVQ